MGKESILYMENQITTRMAAARRLRELAHKIEARQFEMGDYEISLPQRLDMKVELDEHMIVGDRVIELEIEIGWRPQYLAHLSDE
jgi:hypothetical protein